MGVFSNQLVGSRDYTEVVFQGHGQGSKGIRQWPTIFDVPHPMMIHKIKPSVDYN